MVLVPCVQIVYQDCVKIYTVCFNKRQQQLKPVVKKVRIFSILRCTSSVKTGGRLFHQKSKTEKPTKSLRMEKRKSVILPSIGNTETAFTHVPEHGFSLFLAKRQKTIHFIRHAEGYHNQANRAYGDDTPVTFSTPDAWQFIDASLTDNGIAQCVKVRESQMGDVNPELVVVSPFTRTLQTAHIIFGGKGYPFIVHNMCRERSGKFTCDKMRSKTEIINDIKPIYDHSYDNIDFDSFGFVSEEDQNWKETREPSDEVIGRGVEMMKWLATRPENEIAVVTHSSWLKHLFRSFGDTIEDKDKDELHRISGNAEVRSVCLALHKGFYPEGEWVGDTDVFIPTHPSFRRGRWADCPKTLARMHKAIQPKTKWMLKLEK